MSILVIGQHAWGHGDEMVTAKRNFQRNGGQLSRGYTIAEFPPDLVFQGVDQMGRVHWNGSGEPKTTEVAPRKR